MSLGLAVTAAVGYTTSRPDPMLRVRSVGLLVAAPTGSTPPAAAPARVAGKPDATSVSNAWVARTASTAGIPAPAVRA